MEHNEITVRVDVKMDVKERRSEFAVYRHWTRTTLRIEAIKCFPCYVKVTFVHNPQPPTAGSDSVININLPGLVVNLATSRTKSHTYGLFWKNNRNRCCMYLAFDDAEQCARHHHWMQTSIRNLDLHRREIHETRRASRYSQLSCGDGLFGSLTSGGGRSVASSGYGMGGRFNETGNIPDLNEILGPLPAVPDSAVHWSRRISGVSGIYEEILERSAEGADGGFVMMSPQSPLPTRGGGCGGGAGAGKCGSDGGARKLPRASVASGIYEVMRPPMQSIRESIPPSPPPLPPRSRTFTNQEIEFKRSYTNPDTDTFKHRGSSVSGLILNHLHLRQNSGGGLAKPAAAAAAAAAAAHKTQPDDLDSLSTSIKLLSFSSPDLTKLSPAPKTAIVPLQPQPQPPLPATITTAITLTECDSTYTPPSTVLHRIAGALPPTQSMHNLCTSPALLTPNGRTPTTPLRNAFVYDQLRPHTTPSTPLTPTQPQPVGQLIDCASGYCAMAPIILSDVKRQPQLAMTPVQQQQQQQQQQPPESLYMSLDSSKLHPTSDVYPTIDCTDGAQPLPPQLQRSGSSDAENQHHITSAAAAATAAAATIKRASHKLAGLKSPLRSSSTNHHNVAGGHHHRSVTERCQFMTPPPQLRKPPALLRPGGGAATEPRHRQLRPLSIDDKVPSYLPNATATSFAYVNSAQRQLQPALPPKLHSQSAKKASKRTPTKKPPVPPKPRARSEEPDVAAAIGAPPAVPASDTKYSVSTKKPSSSGSSMGAEEADTHSGKRSRLRHRILRSGGGAHAKEGAATTAAADVAAVAVVASNSTPLPGQAALFVDIGDENSAQDLAASSAAAVTRTASGPSTTVEKASKVSELGTSLKRFASMPRFRRLNFSPLKLKFNSVLQR